MKAKVMLFLVCMSLLCSFCSAQVDSQNPEDKTASGDENLNRTSTETSALKSNAEGVLLDFYAFLNQAEYGQAAELYGGSYDLLRGYNPSLAGEDAGGLLEAACECNGFMCLDVLSSSLIEVREQNEFIYEVEFANPDGSRFVLGPCCGADEETMPSVSSFTVQVSCSSEGTCLVMDLPPYVP